MVKTITEPDDKETAAQRAIEANDVAWLLSNDNGVRIMRAIMSFCATGSGYLGEAPIQMGMRDGKREVKERIEDYLRRHQPKLFLGFLEKTFNDEKGDQ